MGKTKKCLIGLGTVFTIAVGTYIYASDINRKDSVDNGGQISVIEIDVNVVYKVEQDQIGEYADLIVLGAPQDELEDRKFVINYFPKDPNDKSDTPEAIQDFYSFVNFKIDAVYKDVGTSKIGNEISIFERVGLITDSEGKKILKHKGYKELQPHQKYVLFLKKSPDADYYHIVRNNDGQEIISSEQDIDTQVQAILKKYKVE